jgi:vanillate O-demethylase monooxygenase subunit
MWLRNCWYVIAWDHEIPADGFLARKVLGEPLLVYRTGAGTLAVLEDRCCHRHAPLSKGRREGDCIRCGYHGLKFDAAGACVEVPGMEAAPSSARVGTYPVAERNHWVFVWMGDPALADATMLPDNFSCAAPGWHYKPGYMHYDTPYLLICDNLLDFSHLSYVHETTLGGTTAIAHARPAIEAVSDPGQRGLRVTRHVPDVPPPPYYAKIRRFEGNVDRWFIYDFLLPGTLLMRSGGRPVGDAPEDMTNAVQLHSCQTLTPETDTSTHYFFQQAHQVEGAAGEAITAGIFQSLLTAFEEDRAMITAQHENLGAAADSQMVALWMDAALLRFRRLLAAAVAAEAGTSGTMRDA